MAITVKQIVGSLATHIDTEFSGILSISYPGDILDTQSLTEWAEIDVIRFRRKIGRIDDLDRWDVTLRVLLAVKRSTSQYRIYTLSKDFSAQLRHKELAIQDFATSGDPTTGRLRLYEPRRNNQSTELNSSKNTNIRVLSWDVPAYAQSI